MGQVSVRDSWTNQNDLDDLTLVQGNDITSCFLFWTERRQKDFSAITLKKKKEKATKPGLGN